MNLRSYLRPSVIVGALPNIISDGQLIDAVPVMNDLQWIVSQVNANVPPLITTGSSPLIFVAASGVAGSANAITLTPSTPIATYAAGQSWRFVAKAVNTGGVTVNISGLGARTLTYANGNPFAGGELQIGGTYDLTDNGTQLMMTNVPVGTGLLSYTPALTFGGASTGMTFSTQSASVMTLGNWVWVWIRMVLTAKGSSTGLASVSLPVKVNNLVAGSGVIPMGSIQFAQVTFTGIPGICPYPNTTLANLITYTSGGNQVSLDDTAFSNSSAINCQVLYPGIA